MWRSYELLAVIVLSALSQTAQAIQFAFEARSLGMGGVGVASADLATAAKHSKWHFRWRKGCRIYGGCRNLVRLQPRYRVSH